MRVLVACEFSGAVRRAFRARGHAAFSCDLLPADDGDTHFHFRGDVTSRLDDGWDMIIAFPPCTHLAASGARWWKEKREDGRQGDAIMFVEEIMNAPCPLIAIENPIGILSTAIRKPDQIIQPWMFGHGETKATCLWLKGLPKLEPTNVVDGREARVHRMGETKDRWRKRSITYQGVAEAMAEQWGSL